MISKNIYKYLNDAQFLQELDTSNIKTFYAKIHVLSWKEEFIESIEGKIISASINIDGNSNMRRTASLNMIADGVINNITHVDNLISINKKMKLEIGFKNTTGKYTEFDIFYFPLGVYVISTAAISHSLDSINISLQLKDKMCLLNGQSGGIIPASVEFHKIDTVDVLGREVTLYPTIYQIIVEAVNHFGGEELPKILISDLDETIKQVVYWNRDIPVYLIASTVSEGTGLYFGYDPPSNVQEPENFKKQMGDAVGFILTDFTYPGELVADAGATVTSVLDNIINILGNYEYFYDVDGNFRFQEKKNFLNNSQAYYVLQRINNLGKTIKNKEGEDEKIPTSTFSVFDPLDAYILDYFTYNKAQYVFNGGQIINSFNNNPQYQNIKNDYIVWGSKKIGDTQIPIRYHLAIDTLPIIDFKSTDLAKCWNKDINDYEYHKPIQFQYKSNLPDIGQEGVYYLIKNGEDKGLYIWQTRENLTTYYKLEDKQAKIVPITPYDWRTVLYLQGLNAEPLGLETNFYYQELKTEWPKIYDLENGCIKQEYIKHPQNLEYYLDIIDSSTIMGQFSVDNIGRRTDVQNLGTDANCIFEPQIPNIIYIENTSEASSSIEESDVQKARDMAVKMGMAYYQVPTSTYQYFDTTRNSLNSCYQEIRQKLQDFVSYNETISFTCLPIYYLQPNIRITVNDSDSEIHDDYLINSMAITIDANSTMTVNATRVLEKI